MKESDVADELSRFPDIAVERIERIEGGWSSHTFLINGELIFRFARFDDITEHYPPTLAEWRRRFNAAWPRLRELGYDARFRRLWNVYLAFSEAGFRERRIGDVQMLLAKPRFGSAELQVALGDDPAVQRPLDERDPLLVLR